MTATNPSLNSTASTATATAFLSRGRTAWHIRNGTTTVRCAGSVSSAPRVCTALRLMSNSLWLACLKIGSIIRRTCTSRATTSSSSPLSRRRGIPGPIDVTVRYDISHEGVLRIGVSARNTSERDIPLGLGWHPYFKVASVRDARVWVPATHRIVVDDDGIPLPALRAFRPIKSDRKGDPLAATAANAVSKADGSEALAPPPAWLPESDVLHEINLHDELDTAFTGLHNDDARAHAYPIPASVTGWRSPWVWPHGHGGAGSVRSGTGSAEQPNRAAVPCRSKLPYFTGPDLPAIPVWLIRVGPCTVMPDMLNREGKGSRVDQLWRYPHSRRRCGNPALSAHRASELGRRGDLV